MAEDKFVSLMWMFYFHRIMDLSRGPVALEVPIANNVIMFCNSWIHGQIVLYLENEVPGQNLEAS